MFVQIHMLQSMPPGNLNRDDTGQPKKCVFGGVTRGRISSQCLKRNIRRSVEFKHAFGDALADRTLYLPRMIADALRKSNSNIPDNELAEIMAAIASKFKKEKKGKSEVDAEAEEGEEKEGAKTAVLSGGEVEKTGQLVFFPPPFAQRIAELTVALRKDSQRAYDEFLGHKIKPAKTKEESAKIDAFMRHVFEASQALTIDIGLFGRMTTSDLVVNVEASCQVAHAISTHETIVESDYFTAMDDRKTLYAKTQEERSGAAFLGSGETETFFSSAVYYKYLNLDVDAVRKHLPSLKIADAARAAGVLLDASMNAFPTGKQNSFASFGIAELVLVELSQVKRPISYANAFLQPVEGGTGRNLMTESAKAFRDYVDSVAVACAPADTDRVFLAFGNASTTLKCTNQRVNTNPELIKAVVAIIEKKAKASV